MNMAKSWSDALSPASLLPRPTVIGPKVAYFSLAVTANEKKAVPRLANVRLGYVP